MLRLCMTVCADPAKLRLIANKAGSSEIALRLYGTSKKDRTCTPCNKGSKTDCSKTKPQKAKQAKKDDCIPFKKTVKPKKAMYSGIKQKHCKPGSSSECFPHSPCKGRKMFPSLNECSQAENPKCPAGDWEMGGGKKP